MIISPFLGDIRFSLTFNKNLASALASRVYGTCIFISSPSKSALKGVQQHSLNLKVFHFYIFASNAMILILCRLGYLLKRIISPFSICLSTTSPISNYVAYSFLFSTFKKNLSPFFLKRYIAPG